MLGNNMFAYCNNNPIIYADKIGTITQNAIDLNGDDDETLDPDSGGGGASIWNGLMSAMDSAAYGLNMATGTRDGSEVHHFLTIRHNSKYTPIFRTKAEKNDLDLNDAWNTKKMDHHRGRHTKAYHDFMLEMVNYIDSIAQSNQRLFLEGFKILIDYVSAKDWLFYAK